MFDTQQAYFFCKISLISFVVISCKPNYSGALKSPYHVQTPHYHHHPTHVDTVSPRRFDYTDPFYTGYQNSSASPPSLGDLNPGNLQNLSTLANLSVGNPSKCIYIFFFVYNASTLPLRFSLYVSIRILSVSFVVFSRVRVCLSCVLCQIIIFFYFLRSFLYPNTRGCLISDLFIINTII